MLEKLEEPIELVLNYKQSWNKIKEIIENIKIEPEVYKDYCKADFYVKAQKDKAEEIKESIEKNMDKLNNYREIILENKTKKQKIEQLQSQLNTAKIQQISLSSKK
jgi:gas vesicle protein